MKSTLLCTIIIFCLGSTFAQNIELPISFDEPSSTIGVGGFRGAFASLSPSPTDPNDMVLSATKPNNDVCFSGVIVGNPGNVCLENPIPFASDMRISVDVYSPIAGTPMLLKVEDCANSSIASEVLVLTTVANAWETLTFDFSTACPAPPSLANTYRRLVIFPRFTCDPDACDIPNPGAAATETSDPYYFNNIRLGAPEVEAVPAYNLSQLFLVGFLMLGLSIFFLQRKF